MARADSDFGRRARPGERKLPLPKKCGQSSERLISWYLSRSAFCLPAHRHLGTRSPSGNARGGCRGCTPKLCVTTKTEKWYNLPETMFLIFDFEFLLRAEFEISPKNQSRGKWKSISPKFLFSFSESI